MIQDNEFVDYYEVLEASPNASAATLERVFRYLAKRYHPDSGESSDGTRFSQLVEAYETLPDPASRAAYDIDYDKFQEGQAALLEETGHMGDDVADRHRLLSLFYAQRRRSIKNPGIGTGTLEDLMKLPEHILQFHLWFFREKGWIMREESGTLSITADGVEKIEATMQSRPRPDQKRIEQTSDKIASAPAVQVPPIDSPVVV